MTVTVKIIKNMGGFPHLSKPYLKFWVISLHEMNNIEKEACEQLLSWNKYSVYMF